MQVDHLINGGGCQWASKIAGFWAPKASGAERCPEEGAVRPEWGRWRDLRSLRRKSVQEAYRGGLACQAPGNGSLPGNAQGFRGQDTVERHGGFDVAMEDVVQQKQEDPASNARERIDDFRLAGSRTWRRRGGHLANGGRRTYVAHQVAHAHDHHNASLSEDGAPRGCGRGFAWKALLDKGWHRFPARLRQPWRGWIRSVQAPRRFPPRASHTRPGGERPPHFCRWCATGQGRWCTPKFTISPPRFWGRSLHSDPWREGHRAPFRAHG